MGPPNVARPGVAYSPSRRACWSFNLLLRTILAWSYADWVDILYICKKYFRILDDLSTKINRIYYFRQYMSVSDIYQWYISWIYIITTLYKTKRPCIKFLPILEIRFVERGICPTATLYSLAAAYKERVGANRAQLSFTGAELWSILSKNSLPCNMGRQVKI